MFGRTNCQLAFLTYVLEKDLFLENVFFFLDVRDFAFFDDRKAKRT